MKLDILQPADIDPAIAGGLLLSAGGSGSARVAQSRRFAERALAAGPLPVCRIADLPADSRILVATAVGAPGAGKHLADPDHAIQAARRLIEASGARIDAVMPGHVPGFYAWLVAAELGVPLVDAACNGRGHPTVRMGSLGLSSRPEVLIHQTGVGANLAITVHGNLMSTSALLRAAAVQAGGLIMACRGPIPASLVAEAGAPGAIGVQLDLGRALLAAGDNGQARLAALSRAGHAQVVMRGRVSAVEVSYRDGFDVGFVEVSAAPGVHVEQGEQAPIRLGVCNEFMTIEQRGRRLSTFPDLQAALDLDSGAVLAISELTPGQPVAILTIAKQKLPMGSGIYDRSIYADVEERMQTPLADHALDLGTPRASDLDRSNPQGKP